MEGAQTRMSVLLRGNCGRGAIGGRRGVVDCLRRVFRSGVAQTFLSVRLFPITAFAPFSTSRLRIAGAAAARWIAPAALRELTSPAVQRRLRQRR